MVKRPPAHACRLDQPASVERPGGGSQYCLGVADRGPDRAAVAVAVDLEGQIPASSPVLMEHGDPGVVADLSNRLGERQRQERVAERRLLGKRAPPRLLGGTDVFWPDDSGLHRHRKGRALSTRLKAAATARAEAPWRGEARFSSLEDGRSGRR